MISGQKLLRIQRAIHFLEPRPISEIVDAVHEGNTALHIAATLGLSNVVLELLQAGASLSLRNSDGLDAAELALANGHDALSNHMEATTLFGNILEEAGSTQGEGGKVEDDVADAFDGARASTARESSKGMDVPARGKK